MRAAAIACLLSFGGISHSALVATYLLNGNFNAEQPGIPSLANIDPYGNNSFGSDTVFGQTRTVLNLSGQQGPGNNAGVDFLGAGLLLNNSYSVEMVIKQTGEFVWRKLLDVRDFNADSGFYIAPGDGLSVYPTGVYGDTPLDDNVYYHVILAVEPSDQIRAYLNGNLEVDFPTNLMVAASDRFRFFQDDAVTSYTEHTNFHVALLRIYSHPIEDAEAEALADGVMGARTISGKLNLGIYQTDKNPTWSFEAQIRDANGTTVEQHTVNVNAAWEYSLQTTLTGSYTVWIKGKHWLANQAEGVVIGMAGASNVDLTLTNGDIDGDNSVTLLDYDIFSEYFDRSSGDSDWTTTGSNGFAPIEADLDGDEAVTLIDYDIFSASFDLAGIP